MEKQSPPPHPEYDTHHRLSRPKRTSVAQLSMLRRLAVIGVLFWGTGELSQTKPMHLEHSEAAVRARTVEDLLYIIRSAIGDVVVNECLALPEDPDSPSDPGIAPLTMGKTALSKAWSSCERLWSKPSETAGDITENVRASARYLRDYRMSEEQASQSDPKTLKCNTHANVTCERLDRLGLPMYLLSLWPEDPTVRFDVGWHQMAACKIRKDCFLIFDDERALLWHGSLASYAHQYGSKVRMRIIPRVGISEYAEPKYDTFVTKFLVQALHSVPDEQEMKSLNLPTRKEIIQIAKN